MNEITQFLTSHGGLILFVVVFVEQLGVRLPSAPWLLVAGSLAAGGMLNPFLSIVMAALACVLADLIWFYLGRRGGRRVLSFLGRLGLTSESCAGHRAGMFSRFRLRGVVAGKFLPGLGAIMPPLAGLSGISARRFLLFDGFASLLYGTSYILLGFLFNEQVERVMAILGRLGLGALGLLVVLVAACVTIKYIQHRKAAAGGTHPEPDEVKTPAPARRHSGTPAQRFRPPPVWTSLI